MDGYKFEMLRYHNGDEWKDIEEEFPGLRYKECKGLNSYGEVMNTYAETYVETSKADVYIPEGKATFKQTKIVLTLYFFDEDGMDSFHKFMAFVTGSLVAYRDNARKRKVLMYLTSATEPKTDTIYGQIYKEVSFTFTNVYGMSFGFDDEFPNEYTV